MLFSAIQIKRRFKVTLSLHGDPANSVHTLKAALEEALGDPAARPRPIDIRKYRKTSVPEKITDVARQPKKISLDEYRQRRTTINPQGSVPRQKADASGPVEKKARGGLLIKIRKELANLYFLTSITVGKEKEKFVREINRLKNMRKVHIKNKKKIDKK